VNAPYIAADRGIEVVESKSATSDDFASLVRVSVKSLEGQNIVSGTIFGKNLPRILRINNFYLEAIPEGHILLIRNKNTPGVIGQITSALARHQINIDRMQVGEEKEKKQNVILITTGAIVDDDILEEIRSFENVFSAQRIEL
jgi:D-3-phosphoglycerate dehydrogenase